MAMFLAEIAFLIELALVAAGLVLWHRSRETSATPVRAAAALLVVGALLTAVCTGYFSVRYHVQGEFDHAYPQMAMAGPGSPRDPMMQMMMERMGKEGMGMPGMPMKPGGPPAEAPHPGQEEHHPDAGE